MPHCKEIGCKVKNATYGLINTKIGLFCATHSKNKPNMIDVKHPRCQKEDCESRPNFNVEGEKKGIYCVKHKESTMVDVVNPRCQKEGCKLRSTFNVEGEKKAIYCGKCKEPNMVDVLNPRCQKENCESRPSFNFEGQKAILCCEHKENGMIDVVHRRCKEYDCYLIPTFNVKGEKKGIYCDNHKKSGMINVLDPRCKSDLCDTLAKNKKYEGYCMPCFINNPENSDKPAMRNYKTKELEVVNHIKKHFRDYLWIFDRRIQGGVFNRRPDIFLDLGKHIIIIEIDEDMHSSYTCACETNRINEIIFNVDYKPITLIRFNPDKYKDCNGIIIKSCWKLTKQGVMTISKKKEWSERINKLIETVKHFIEFKSDEVLNIIQLFY